jgi:hypothetical protein
VRSEWSVGHGEVAHLSDTAGGVPHAVAFASTVAQDVPGLHVCQCVLDAGTNTFVRDLLRTPPLAEQLRHRGPKFGIGKQTPRARPREPFSRDPLRGMRAISAGLMPLWMSSC